MMKTSWLGVAVVSVLGACAGEHPADPAAMKQRLDLDLVSVMTQAQAAGQNSFGTIDLTSLEPVLSLLGGDTSADAIAREVKRAADPGDGTDPASIAASLEATVFTDANYQGGGIYALPASLLCDADDATCAMQVAAMQPRIRAMQSGDEGLALSLQLGANHDELVALDLDASRLAVTLDLDGMQAALEPLLGAARVGGAVTAALDVLGDAHVKASLTVDRRVAIQSDATTLTIEPSVISADLNGPATTAALDVQLGAIAAPDVSIPGLDATVEMQPAQIAITRFQPAGAFVLPDETVTIAPLQAVIIPGALSSTIDLQIQRTSGAPIGYDITRLRFDGGITARDNGAFVVNGTLDLTANPQPYSLLAEPGQCIAPSTAETDDGTPFTTWATVSCE